MEEPPNPYAVLGVEPDATDDAIHSAYRRLAQKFHPDRFSGSPLAEQEAAAERMRVVNAAWEMVGSGERRRQYDQASPAERERLADVAATLGPGFGLQLWGVGGRSTRLTIDPLTRHGRRMKAARRYLTAWADDLSPLRKLYPEEMAGLWLLHGRDAGDDAMDHVAALPWLEVLDLRDTSVTSLGVAKLAHFKSLRCLNLAGALINDRAIETLGRLGSLQELSLVDTAITDACVPHLVGLPRLQVLNLEGTRITGAGVRQLVESPSLEILNAPGRVPWSVYFWAFRHRRGLAIT